ncbi:hypothetical protein Tco_1049978, partial [Tanacetum coccineum]
IGCESGRGVDVSNDVGIIRFRTGSDSGYSSNSLMEQWMETKRDDGYEPYNDDLYESHDMSDNLQAI